MKLQQIFELNQSLILNLKRFKPHDETPRLLTMRKISTFDVTGLGKTRGMSRTPWI